MRRARRSRTSSSFFCTNCWYVFSDYGPRSSFFRCVVSILSLRYCTAAHRQFYFTVQLCTSPVQATPIQGGWLSAPLRPSQKIQYGVAQLAWLICKCSTAHLSADSTPCYCCYWRVAQCTVVGSGQRLEACKSLGWLL
eukprot:scpid19949/ scgid32347/ 